MYVMYDMAQPQGARTAVGGVKNASSGYAAISDSGMSEVGMIPEVDTTTSRNPQPTTHNPPPVAPPSSGPGSVPLTSTSPKGGSSSSSSSRCRMLRCPDAWVPQIVVLVALLALSLWGMFRASAGDLHRLTRCLIHLRAASIGPGHHPLVPTGTQLAACAAPQLPNSTRTCFVMT
ncbi:hypothetical protein LA080_012430 [Diaporthe eres]|nr:hypothetical protein LA080_012430 [Diaporthe eres]